jgi:hypothetical protein
MNGMDRMPKWMTFWSHILVENGVAIGRHREDADFPGKVLAN